MRLRWLWKPRGRGLARADSPSAASERKGRAFFGSFDGASRFFRSFRQTEAALPSMRVQVSRDRAAVIAKKTAGQGCTRAAVRRRRRGGTPPPRPPSPPPPLPMFGADSQNFASAPRGLKQKIFRPAFGGDHAQRPLRHVPIRGKAHAQIPNCLWISAICRAVSCSSSSLSSIVEKVVPATQTPGQCPRAGTGLNGPQPPFD